MVAAGVGRGRREPLSATHPEVATNWMVERNLPQTPGTVTAKARTEVWWECEAGHDFRAPIYLVAALALTHNCPTCQAQRLVDLDQLWPQLLASHPVIAAAGREEEPMDGLTFGDHGLRQVQCPQGHQPRISPWR